MGRIFDGIDSTLRQWLDKQPMFFVATAPNDPTGHVNCSPKGGTGIFQVLGPTAAAYVDLVGSGAETVAHLRENSRIVLMFCAFSGPPKIVRLHGQGRVVPEEDVEFAELLPRFSLTEESRPLARGIIVIDIERISDSCGFGVPRMEMVAERDQLLRWSEQQHAKNGDDWKLKYMGAKNAASIDGLPAYDTAERLEGGEVATTVG